MASLHEARPTTSTSTGTPAAVRAVPHRVAGTLLAVGPEPPPAAVVLCFPGVAPQPATTPAASSTKALAATARERPRMGPPFPRNHHALYQRALPSRRPSHAKPVTPVDDRVAYLAHPMHNFSEKSGPCPDSDQVLGRTHGRPGGGGGRQRLRGRGTSAHHRRPPGSGTRAARRRDERRGTGHGGPSAPGPPWRAHLRAAGPGPAVMRRPGFPRAPARGIGRRQRRPARRGPRGGSVGQLPPGRSAGMVGVLPDAARRSVVLRTARTARRAGADRRRAAGGGTRLLRHGRHPGSRAPGRCGAGRAA